MTRREASCVQQSRFHVYVGRLICSVPEHLYILHTRDIESRSVLSRRLCVPLPRLTARSIHHDIYPTITAGTRTRLSGSTGKTCGTPGCEVLLDARKTRSLLVDADREQFVANGLRQTRRIHAIKISILWPKFPFTQAHSLRS